MTEVKNQLENEIDFAHFHSCKELENYLLYPEILARASTRAIEERARRTGESLSVDLVNIVNALKSITEGFKSECSGQYVSKYCAYLKSTGKDQATLTTEALDKFDKKWSGMESRLEIVPGKKVLRAVRDRLQESHGVTLTDLRIVDCYRADEIPEHLATLVRQLEGFRSGAAG